MQLRTWGVVTNEVMLEWKTQNRLWRCSVKISACCVSCSVVSGSLQPCGLLPIRLLCPWDSPGKNTEWVAIPISRGSSQPRDQTWVSCVSCSADGFFTCWALREAPKMSVQFSSVAQSYLTLCDPMNCSTPGLPVHHQLLEFTQTHVHWVSDAIQPSHPLSSPSSPALNLSQQQGLFQWVSCSYQMAQVWELQL